MTNARLYLRASTSEQDASRARADLETFAAEHGLSIVGTFTENESGAKLARPELFRLLSDSRPGDVLLIEQVDRLSRLTADDWQRLRSEIDARKVRVVALDLPTSWMLADNGKDEFTARMFAAINAMMLDMLAAVARKDYDDRRRRQRQGVEKAKAEGKYRGRVVDHDKRRRVGKLLDSGMSWGDIVKTAGCSKAMISAVARERKSVDLFATLEKRKGA